MRKFKSELGSITVVVFATVTFILIILATIFTTITLKRKSQQVELQELKLAYDGDMANIYEVRSAKEVILGTPTGMKNATSNETIYKTASADGEVTPLSTTGTTTVKDNKNNEIKVPKNFGIAFDSGDNVADGVVIEDTSHNQYVWIPVGTITNSSGASKTIDLIRSNFNGTTTSNAETVINSYFYEYNATSGSSYGNTKAKNISEFVSSANTNHGYYLARYEAGINASQ
ncbi:MAG: hypothetical protein IKG14_02435, partial [Clostridia bacterium]|nr:hypothetical protein [Clostridia bacterium]